MGITKSQVTFGTFHGVLRHFKAGIWACLGNILTEEEKYGILKTMVLEYGEDMSGEGDFLEDIAKEISVIRGNRISPEHY